MEDLLRKIAAEVATGRRERDIKEHPELAPFIKEIETKIGTIKEIHDESKMYKEEDDYDTPSTFFRIVTVKGLFAVILSKDLKKIAEIHDENNR